MNATAGNGGNGSDEISDLKAQRAHLLAEIRRLREERREAMLHAIELQQENAALKRRIAELEGES